jgi:hypothetical protein
MDQGAREAMARFADAMEPLNDAITAFNCEAELYIFGPEPAS